MNDFKAIFFLLVLGFHVPSLSASESIESVMDIVDRGEDLFLKISRRVNTFLCGIKEMDTDLGRGINILLCGTKNQVDTDGFDSVAHEVSSTLSSSQLPKGMKFVTIQPDKFKMGSPEGEKGQSRDEQQVEVRLTKSFEIMITEVTQFQWFEVTRDNPSYFNKKEYCPDEYRIESTDKGEVELCPTHPVESVSWDMVQEFIEKLNQNQIDCLKTSLETIGCVRLPTEAEWEFATRGGTETAYSFGDDPADLDTYAWYYENSNGQTHRVRLKSSNPWGLFDMHGNVWEWVQDNYKRKLLGGEDPLIDSGSSIRVMRGGSWDFYPRNLRSANRYDGQNGGNDVGFRLVKTL